MPKGTLLGETSYACLLSQTLTHAGPGVQPVGNVGVQGDPLQGGGAVLVF
jgi:hypothetical protein